MLLRYTRTHEPCVSGLWVEEGAQRPVGRPCLFSPLTARATAAKNATSHKLQRGCTSASAWPWVAHRGVDCPRVGAAKAVSLSQARHLSALGTRHMSARQRRDLVPIIVRPYQILEVLAFDWSCFTASKACDWSVLTKAMHIYV